MHSYQTPRLTDQIYYVSKEIIDAIAVDFSFIAGAGWHELYKRESDQSFWRLDKYDRLQEIFFVKLPSEKDWDTYDSRELQMELLLKSRGLSDGTCVWLGCQKAALQGLAYCERHAYLEMGIRK